MSTDDLYPLWRKRAIKKAREAVDVADCAFESLNDKGSIFGRSIAAMRDMHRQALAAYESSPEQLKGKP